MRNRLPGGSELPHDAPVDGTEIQIPRVVRTGRFELVGIIIRCSLDTADSKMPV